MKLEMLMQIGDKNPPFSKVIHKNLLSKKSNAPLIQSRNIISVEELSVFYS
jgi:hypothetical protein